MRLLGILLLTTACVKPCIRSEQRLVHHDAWTQMIPQFDSKGNIYFWLPIYHPAYSSLETVCVEREQ